MLDCNSTAVLVFRSVIGDRAIHARNLDPHFAPGRVNALPLPRQRLSLLISLPDFPWPDVDTLVDHVCDIQIRGLREPVPQPKEPS